MTMMLPNSPSFHEPNTMMATNSTPRIRLNQVKTLVRTMSQVVRPPGRGAALVLPAASRSRTSAEVRPAREGALFPAEAGALGTSPRP